MVDTPRGDLARDLRSAYGQGLGAGSAAAFLGRAPGPGDQFVVVEPSSDAWTRTLGILDRWIA